MTVLRAGPEKNPRRLGHWIRVTRQKRCPCCESDSWCAIAEDGSAAICMRRTSDYPTRNGGFLHRLRDSRDRQSRPVRRMRAADVTRCDFGALSARYEKATTDGSVADLAARLGVTADSLRRLHVGRMPLGDWTFPMRSATGAIIGLRTRQADGQKKAVTGSRSGLFYPIDLSADGTLYITEGPTDCAALLSVGLAAIGRPDCTGGVAHLLQLARGRGVVIVADRDEPGIRGAGQLAGELRRVCPDVTIILPPQNCEDARAWIGAGATRIDIERTQNEGPTRSATNVPRRAMEILSDER